MEGQTGHSRRLASRTSRTPETVTNHCCHCLPSCTAPAHRVTSRWEWSGHLRCLKLTVTALSKSSSLCFSMILYHKVEFILLFFPKGDTFYPIQIFFPPRPTCLIFTWDRGWGGDNVKWNNMNQSTDKGREGQRGDLGSTSTCADTGLLLLFQILLDYISAAM